jgi:hypothetical protein
VSPAKGWTGVDCPTLTRALSSAPMSSQQDFYLPAPLLESANRRVGRVHPSNPCRGSLSSLSHRYFFQNSGKSLCQGRFWCLAPLRWWTTPVLSLLSRHDLSSPHIHPHQPTYLASGAPWRAPSTGVSRDT